MRISILIVMAGLFLTSCQYGTVSDGVGESERYVDLMDRITNEISFTESTFNQLYPYTNFTDISLTNINRIMRTKPSYARLEIPGFKVSEEFDKTEIIFLNYTFSDEFGNSENIQIKLMVATKDVYFSEADYPVNELFYIQDFPFFEEDALVISYRRDQKEYQSIEYAEIESRNGIYEYYFNDLPFAYFDYSIDDFRFENGTGEMHAKKEGSIALYKF